MTQRQLILVIMALAIAAYELRGVIATVIARASKLRPPGWLANNWQRLAAWGLVGFCLVAAFGLPSLPSLPVIEWQWPGTPDTPAPSKVTAVTYTFEKDEHVIPAPVQAALNTLNRQGIVATLDEIDTPDGTGDVPDQYKLTRPAAREAGLPALVVSGGGKVIRVVKSPTTEAAVLEAAK